MTVCHECGSEVAKTDVFCPYCGISIQPVAFDEPDADESMDGTIMIQREDIAARPEQQSEAAMPNLDTGEDLQASAFEESAESVDDSAEELGGFDNIPAPSILSEPAPTSDNVIAGSTSDLMFDEMEKPEQTSEANDIVLDEPDAIEEDFQSQEIKSTDIAQPLPDAIEKTEDSIVWEEAATELEAVAADEDISSLAETPIDTDVAAEPANAKVSDKDEELFRERMQLSDHKIAKPLERLESDDGYLAKPIFDSVRIMENKVPDAQEYIETRIASDPGGRKSQVEDLLADSPVVGVNTAADDKIGTAPNIGVGDTDGKKGSKLKPLAEGTVLNGRYEIVRKIGGGGMGAVYLASDNNLGGVLRAVKEMVQAHIEEEQQDKAVNDFKRESMILSTLDHSAIPTIYDYFYDEKESRFYLVMKYISGGDLSSRLRSAPEGKIDEKSITDWAIQIIDVLDYLHNQPSTIVYRDLKPSNIMIDGNSGRIMLIDFGIARSINQKEEKGVTAVGTMGYAPPELFSGNVEPRSDIYSLGSTMFHLLTGADPQSNPLLIFDFQKNPRPRQINPQLSDQIERILMRSVEYSADSRFSSAAEMRNVLEEHFENLKSGNLTYGVTEVPTSVSLANQNVFCGFCGQRIVATDLFCAFCGAKQPLAQHGVHSEIYSHSSWTAKLVIEGTSELVTPAFTLQKDENLVGRRDPMSNIFPEVDLSKYDPQTKISRRHARIWRDGNNFLVEDLGSSNGTILAPSITDSFRLQPHQPHALTSGDKLKIGDTTLHFVIG